MAVKKGEIHELFIEGLAFGGRGLAKIDGLTVFVHQAAPGDRVHARIVKKRRSYAEARIVTIEDPSPHRVTAPCPYSGYCGGCTWQFLDYATQLAYKQRHVREALEHIGMIHDVPVHPTLAAGPTFAYRNKMEFSCADRRWLMPEEMARGDLDAGFALGLHVPGTYHKVLDTAACLLQPDLGNRLLGEVRGYIKDSGLPVYGLRSHEGFWRFLTLRHSVAIDRWMVNIITAAEDRGAVQPLADGLMERYPAVVGVVNNITARRSGVAVGEVEIPLAGAAFLRDRIGPFDFQISANSFFQTNTRGATRLYATVKEYCELSGRETVVDLYSGTGTIAICLSDGAAEVVGIEIVPAAVADARDNCRLNGVDNCRFILGDIGDCLGQVGVAPDVVVIDPPRTGMHKDVVAQVLGMAPPRLVYVSCNPATLARDLGLLRDRYRVVEVQPVDMFPHTYHIEAVAKLIRL